MKVFQFKVYDEKLITWLERQENLSDFIRNSLDDIRNGVLTSGKNSGAKEERLRLQNLKTKLEIWGLLKIHGFTLDQAQQAFSNSKALPQLELTELNQKFETVMPVSDYWKHFCNATAREVELVTKISPECKLCGVKAT